MCKPTYLLKNNNQKTQQIRADELQAARRDGGTLVGKGSRVPERQRETMTPTIFPSLEELMPKRAGFPLPRWSSPGNFPRKASLFRARPSASSLATARLPNGAIYWSVRSCGDPALQEGMRVGHRHTRVHTHTHIVSHSLIKTTSKGETRAFDILLSDIGCQFG